MEQDERQERRDQRREKERSRMVVHKVKSPRSGERLVKLMVKHTLKTQGIKRPRRLNGVRGPKPITPR